MSRKRCTYTKKWHLNLLFSWLRSVLDFYNRSQKPAMQNIDDMDIDQVVDVPDTPDRLAAHNINREVCVENGSDTSVDADSGKSNFIVRGRSRLISEDGIHRGLHFRGHKTFNNFEATKHQNKAIFHSPESSSVSKNTHIYRRVVEGKTSMHETRNPIGDQLMDKGKALYDKSMVNASTFQEGNADLDLMEQTGYSRILGKALTRGASKDCMAEEFKEGSIATNTSLHCMPNSSKTAGTYCKGKEKAGEDTSGGLGMDHRKGIDFSGGFPSKTGKFVSAPLRSIASPRVTGQKRLVRNGCISPHNIAKVKQSSEQKQNSCYSKDAGGTNTGNLVSRSPSCLIDISDLSADGNNHIRTKGKGVLNSSPTRELDAKTMHFPGSSIRHNEEANRTSNVNGNVSGCFEELGGWRSTGNRSKKMHLPLPNEDVNLPRIHNVANTLIKTQKKHGSTSSNHGEYSASDFDDSEIMFLGSSLASSNSSSSRNWSSRRGCILDPVIEVDELSPEVGPRDSHHVAHKNDGVSDARARQLEADEILALELQQQLYQETPIRGGGEIDAHIAWTLQQGDAAEHASSSGNLGVLHPRGSSISAMHRQSRTRSFQNPSHRRRLHARVSTSSRLAQLRSQVRSQAPPILPRGRSLFPLPSDMDLDMRIDILEALEAAYGDFGDMRMEDHILQVQRDFNENDYEMLLVLDENNYQHGGAHVDRINRLPESVVQTENLEEACAICLETPTTGETIRHLPCLHKFHKDCIDPWLSRRSSCPVCKSSIT